MNPTPTTPQTLVIASDSFKGTATATEVAAALAEGWSSERPSDTIVMLPMADGGEGTRDAFEVAVPNSLRLPVRVEGPDDRMVDAHWLRLPASDADPGGVGVVELAATSGLTLLDPLLPLDAHTRGFGQAIVAALDGGVSRLILAIGGSSSTDGGIGALEVLGGRFLDERGERIRAGNRELTRLARVELDDLRPLPPGGAAIVSDVTNPLLGPRGAARVFGPQKGADETDVVLMDANLARLAALLGGDPDDDGAGAAGGVGYGLMSWGAQLAPGAAAVGDALDLPAVIAVADVVITGEGRFDSQSAAGKVPAYVASVASARGVPVLLVAGSIRAATDDYAATADLTLLAGSASAAMADPVEFLRAAGAQLARDYSAATVSVDGD